MSLVIFLKRCMKAHIVNSHAVTYKKMRLQTHRHNLNKIDLAIAITTYI